MPRSNISLEMWCVSNNCVDLLNHLINDSDKGISYSSHIKVGWKCELGHEFYIDPCKFTNPARCRGNIGVFKCPTCSGQNVLKGYNDLATTRPDLASEWDYNKNTILPNEVTKGSHKDVWWLCVYGHSWKARISARDYGNGCPYCSKKKTSSQPEKLLYLYCKRYFNDSLSNYLCNGISVDIFIPSLNIAIEYDGSLWHDIHNTDYKYEALKEIGVTLYTISGLETSRHNTYIFNDYNLRLTTFPNNLTIVLSKFFMEVFNISLDFSDYLSLVNEARDLYYSSCNIKLEITDDMRSMWSPLNGYSIDYIQNDNTDKYWVCNFGHTFKRRYDVFKRGVISCPYCSNKVKFDYFAIFMSDDIVIVLDMSNGDLETILKDDLFKYIEIGVNIRGIYLSNDILVYDKDYITNIKPTSFRSAFIPFYSTGFTCKSNDYFCREFTNYLNNCISTISVEKLHDVLSVILKKGCL